MGDRPHVVILCGGLGGARLALAAVENDWADRALFVTNVADDWEVGDLLVCPDTDAVVYGLTGRFDELRGWGIAGDEFPGPRSGEPAWFGIGRQDRTNHECRTNLMRSGRTLSDATSTMVAGRTGARVVPATDARVRTRLRTGSRWLSFQSWLIEHHAPPVDEVRWDGLEHAVPAPGVLDAIAEADLVMIASSSPVASISPIVRLAGVAAALRSRWGPVVALSPISTRPFTNERDSRRASARRRLMDAMGLEHDIVAVAAWLAPLITHFVVDEVDGQAVDRIESLGLVPIVSKVLGLDGSDRAVLSGSLLGETICRT